VIVVDPMNPAPYYVQIADMIEAQIKARALKRGDPLPESTIQQRYGVARGTARKAVAVLRERELVTTIPQRGTYVL
jgi:GntR family transcriptional regulator